MSQKTSIEWTDSTWNPIRGCTRISPGCIHCYAEENTALRSDPGRWGAGYAKRTPDGARWTGKVELIEKHLEDPLRWRKPRRIFVNSMSDLFHEALSDDDILRVFDVIYRAHLTRDHTFQILTKRPNRMRGFCKRLRFDYGSLRLSKARSNRRSVAPQLGTMWLGVSVENQRRVDERLPVLITTPAAVRFLSCEPLLERLDLNRWLATGKIDWVIVGAESGRRARPMDLDWVRDLRDQCNRNGVHFFFKQDAEKGRKIHLPILDGRQWTEMPPTQAA